MFIGLPLIGPVDDWVLQVDDYDESTKLGNSIAITEKRHVDFQIGFFRNTSLNGYAF